MYQWTGLSACNWGMGWGELSISEKLWPAGRKREKIFVITRHVDQESQETSTFMGPAPVTIDTMDPFVQCCFTSTETVPTLRDGEPRTATSTSTRLLISAVDPFPVDLIRVIKRLLSGACPDAFLTLHVQLTWPDRQRDSQTDKQTENERMVYWTRPYDRVQLGGGNGDRYIDTWLDDSFSCRERQRQRDKQTRQWGRHRQREIETDRQSLSRHQ